jgi:hypothetical protein
MMCTFDIAKNALFSEQLTSCAYVQALLVKITAKIDGCARYKHELVEASCFVCKGDLGTHKHFAYFKLWMASR